MRIVINHLENYLPSPRNRRDLLEHRALRAFGVNDKRLERLSVLIGDLNTIISRQREQIDLLKKSVRYYKIQARKQPMEVGESGKQ